jgi:phytoene dehydrogenase-like protein
VSAAIVIGAGHNGLTAAFYLAKAGATVTVIERRDVVGGGAATEEIAPGCRCPTLAHAIGPLHPSIVRDMDLERRGVVFIRPDPRLIALSHDGRAISFADVARTTESIRAFSTKDADRYPEFCATLQRLGGFLAAILERTPPSLNPAGAGEMWDLLTLGRRFRALGRADGFRLLRWMPMAAADLVAEWFETDLLQAAIAARGVYGTALGPWSAGSGAVMLLNAAADPAAGGSSMTVKGGPGALAAAMAAAATDAGAAIRTGAGAARIVTTDGRATGVALDNGEELRADVIVSAADPRRTFLGLLDPFDLDPSFLAKMRNYRCPGTVAKMNLVLGALPAFRGAPSLGGRLHIGPSIDYIERAFDASKYGELPEEPYLDVAIPTLADPSLAPAGRHVMSIVAQFAPYRLRGGEDWSHRRDDLGARVMAVLEPYAPGIGASVEHRQVLTPADLETTYGFTGGHIHHGELSLDQLFTMRPVLGWSQYRTPIDALYLCGAGTHGTPGITGLPGRNAAREIARDLRRSRTAAR